MLSKNDELFLTVAKSESISKAAEQLYISQPSLTKRMQQLEAQLDRSGYKLRSLELLQVLAMDARNRGDKAKCGAWLARMRQESGKTAFRKWAAEWNA